MCVSSNLVEQPSSQISLARQAARRPPCLHHAQPLLLEATDTKNRNRMKSKYQEKLTLKILKIFLKLAVFKKMQP